MVATNAAVNNAVLLLTRSGGGGLGIEVVVEGGAWGLEGRTEGAEAGEGKGGGEGTHLHIIVRGVVQSLKIIRTPLELPMG